jgi:hypothetical protein
LPSFDPGQAGTGAAAQKMATKAVAGKFEIEHQ